MDVYGAFQLCSIGILVAPMTVRLSKTYFNTPGRNTIFLWAGLILAGKHCFPRFIRVSVAYCIPMQVFGGQDKKAMANRCSLSLTYRTP